MGDLLALLGALAMLSRGLGQGVVLLAAGTSWRHAREPAGADPLAAGIERLHGLVLLAALYFTLLAFQHAPA